MDASSWRLVKSSLTPLTVPIVLLVCTVAFAAVRAESPPSEAAAPTAVEPRSLESLLGLGGDGGHETLTIESEALELETLADEGRLFTFEGNVRVRQGELELRSRLLEAHYPPQESEPSRLVATGAVEVDQPGQRAFCAEAEYIRQDGRLICRGGARLVQGCDVVAGESIEFDLAENRVRVIGAARVVIAPRDGAKACTPGAEGPGDGGS